MSTSTPFSSFSLDPRLVDAVATLGFDEPTPIQAAAIPVLLDGRDVVGRARTGSGKTAAFGLPLLHRVRDGGPAVRALLLAPTRELALQVTRNLRDYAAKIGLRIFAVYGGTPYGPQLHALREGVHVVVGTPGRVLDLVRGGHLDLSQVECLVLDEADEMLNLGFLEDVDAIISTTPRDRQVCLFSATMPDEIRAIAAAHLNDPVEVQVEEGELTTQHIEQRWIRVPPSHRIDALIRVLQAEPRETALVFARTRAECSEIADTLATKGVAVDALHGDLNQGARERVLRRLRARSLDLLIATDVAARGIDVAHITHVINLELPKDKEQYVHRIGRTGRAGRAGVAITFVPPKHRFRVRALAKSLGVDIREVPVPSEADIGAARRARLQRDLGLELGDNLDAARAWIAEVQEDTAWSMEQVALAAVALLAAEREVPLVDADDAGPPAWARAAEGDRDPENHNEVELFFPVGRTKGIRPGDLVGAIANDCDVPGREIGRVTILDRKSFVGLSRATAEAILARHSTLVVRGQSVPISAARPKEPWGDRPPHPDRGPRFQREDDRGPRFQREDDRGPHFQREDDRGPRFQREDDRGPRPARDGERGPRFHPRDGERGPRFQRQDDRGPRPPRDGERGPRFHPREDERGPRFQREEDRGPRPPHEGERGPRPPGPAEGEGGLRPPRKPGKGGAKFKRNDKRYRK